ncbi:unnamed protein product, partial [Eruca vesicaria subsp. sativa]|nr:unnamed protein product [Eruca vesicaria subsp. sativa]
MTIPSSENLLSMASNRELKMKDPAKHVEEVLVEKLAANIYVLNKLEKVYGRIKEKENLEEELILAQERLAE